jgi:hypothetical protein
MREAQEKLRERQELVTRIDELGGLDVSDALDGGQRLQGGVGHGLHLSVSVHESAYLCVVCARVYLSCAHVCACAHAFVYVCLPTVYNPAACSFSISFIITPWSS